MKNENFGFRLGRFFRANALYLVLAFCLIAVGLSVVLIMTNDSKTVEVISPVSKEESGSEIDNPIDDPIGPVSNVVVFISPIESYTKVQEFSDSLVWNETLKRFSSHKAMDFYADEGTKVFCVYGGAVESVNSDLLTGITVTVDHGNGLKTVYNSIDEVDDLYAGKILQAGDEIGVVSTTNRQEYKVGSHLHFEAIENGISIDPNKYLLLDNK